MNAYTRPLLLVLLKASVSVAFAGGDAAPAPLAQATAPPAAVAAAAKVLAFRDFESTYILSNGRQMAVTAQDGWVRVRYGRMRPQLLRHDGLGHFVSGDGQIVLTFELDQSGDARHLRLSLPRALA